MILALAVSKKDECLGLQTLEWARTLDGTLDYDCLLALGDGVSDALTETARKLFRVVTVLKPGSPETWPHGKNHAFQTVCRYVFEKQIRQPFLYWQCDAIPLKKGWVQAIEKAHTEGGKPFSGPVHQAMQMMEAVAVYPWNFIEFSPQLGMLCRAASWDRVAREDILPHCHPINHLIQCVHDIDGFPPTFEGKESMKLLKPGAVLFHRNKDGTLAEQLSAGKWKRLFSFSPKANDYGVVTLRRAGDIISLLPCIKKIAEERKKPVRMVVHREYENLFDGVSYAKPELWDGDWEDPLAAAEKHRAINAQVLGKNVVTNWQSGNFVKDAWKMLGRPWDRYAPVVFDKRNERRELELAENTLATGPVILVKLHGHSSPFKDAAAVRNRLAMWSDRCQVVFLDDFKYERVYDILGLMDRACCLVSMDTVTLHLAGGSRVPVIAFVNGKGWSATPPRGNVVLRMDYTEVLNRWSDVESVIAASLERTANSRMVQVYHYYTPRSEEGKKRNREAFSTWGKMDARLHPFIPQRTSAAMGDAYTLPYIRDMISSAFNSGDEGIAVLINNDIQTGDGLSAAIRARCEQVGCYWARRLDVPGGVTDGGIDLIAVTRSWWKLHERQYPDLFLGQRHWDQVMRKLMQWTDVKEGARLYYHTPHDGVVTRNQTPAEIHNVKAATAWYRFWQDDDQQ